MQVDDSTTQVAAATTVAQQDGEDEDVDLVGEKDEEAAPVC